MKARIGQRMIEIDETRVRDNGAQVHMRSSSSASTATPCKRSDASPTYRSKLEAAYATYLHGLKLAGDIMLYRYEPVTLRLANDVRYTPDFWIAFKNGSEEYHEVKGYAKGLLASKGMVKVKVAASQWPTWKFVLVTRYRGVWEQRELEA